MANKTLLFLFLVVLISVGTCHKAGKSSAGNKRVCKYKQKQISKCDDSGMRTITLTSKKGKRSGQRCPNKVITKQCSDAQILAQMKKEDRKLGCKYSKGVWGVCNVTSNRRQLTQALLNRDKLEEGCRPQRVIVKPCKIACRYIHGEWSECDGEINKRSRQLTLIEGSPADCPKTDVKTKKCTSAKGKEKCFYSKWSNVGECLDGRVTRTRKVLAGGDRCNKNVSQSKKCINNTIA
ncbi:uncharacterized protein [Antedon mediterranea]